VRRQRDAGSFDYQAFWHRNSGYIMIIAITALAAFLRLWQLGDLPPGLHGDEGWTGIDAHRIMDEGWIGPYVPSALGQPSGPLYWTAIVLSIVGDGVFQVRFAMALLGIITIPVTYLAARVMFDSRRVALVSALMLAVMSWHLVYSRIAFMAVSWPLFEMLTVLFLFLALKLRNQLWFASAGLALGLGVYTYNVYPLFLGAVLVFTALQIIQVRPSRRNTMAIGFAIMAVCTLIAALPLLRYAMDDKNDYWAHHRIYGLQGQLEWKAADRMGRIEILLDKTRDYVKLVTWGEHPDSVDATGRKPMLDWVGLLLVLGGIYWCLKHILEPQSQLILIMLLVLPLGSILSIEAGVRRTLGLAPFLAMLMALSVDRLWTLAHETSGRWRRPLWIAGPVAVVLFAVFNVGAYFQDYGHKDTFARWVWAQQIAEASEYAHDAPGRPYVYFFSGRWSYNYETRRYLAMDVPGEDRSTQFGRFDLNFDRSRDSLVLLLPPYFEVLDQLKTLYPGIEPVAVSDQGETLFIAMRIPKR
jgi:4-amino-4-deoxy-L-arabinose transferase-like glycosyltransferase